MPEDAADAPDRGPTDTAILDRIAAYLVHSDRFSDIQTRPESAPTAVIADYDLGYFPGGVTRAYLQIRWFETDDFSIQYSEQYQTDNEWECRWDRHPNDHNAREHFHPPQMHRHLGKMPTIPTTGRTYSQSSSPTSMIGSTPSGTRSEPQKN